MGCADAGGFVSTGLTVMEGRVSLRSDENILLCGEDGGISTCARLFRIGSLGVSWNTVRTHSRNIYTKMGVHSRQELIDAVDDMRRAGVSRRP